MDRLTEIGRLTKEYSDARNKLSVTLQNLEFRTENLKRQFLPGIKRQVRIVREREALLSSAIDGNRGLFIRPRTVIMHGIKVGLAKGKGLLIIKDVVATIRLIKKHFQDQVDVLIKTKETPRKKALEALSVVELKSIGVMVEGTGDRVVIAPVDGQVEKLVDKLLKEKAEEQEEGE